MKRYIMSTSDVDARDIEILKCLSGLGDKDLIYEKQQQYIHKCVAEAPQVPDESEGEEAWSAYARDAKEYKMWCLVDAVDLGIFTEGEKRLFNKLWKQAEADMAQPYA